MAERFVRGLVGCVVLATTMLIEGGLATTTTLTTGGSAAPTSCVVDSDCGIGGAGLKCCPSISQCYDPAWQSCCEGASVCISAYEECCNSTCCNKANSRCKTTEKLGGEVKVCTTNQWLSPQRGFLVIGLPIIVLSGLLVVVLLVTFRVQQTTLSPLQTAICILSYFGTLVGALMVFSPLWAMGCFIAFLSLTSAASATTTAPFPVGVGIVAHFACLMILINPFALVHPASFAPSAPKTGLPDYFADGGVVDLFRNYAHSAMHPVPVGATGPAHPCQTFYLEYFTYDAVMRDHRIHNPSVAHYGFCSQEWLTALHILSILSVALSILILSLLAAWFARVSRLFDGRVQVRLAAVAPLNETGAYGDVTQTSIVDPTSPARRSPKLIN